MAKKYLINGRTVEGRRNAEAHLNALYADMCADCCIDYGTDSAAWRQDFHQWKDALHRDGAICDAACNDLCPTGAKFGGGR